MFAPPQLIQTEVFTEVPTAVFSAPPRRVRSRSSPNMTADCKTLYITDSSTGTILMARVPTAGRVLYSHM